MAGFSHSAFVLGYEAGLTKNIIDGNLVPPGALVSFVQKGLQYLELEANLNEVLSLYCPFVMPPISCSLSEAVTCTLQVTLSPPLQDRSTTGTDK